MADVKLPNGNLLTVPDDWDGARVDKFIRNDPDIMGQMPDDVIRSYGTDAASKVTFEQHYHRVRANRKARPGEKIWADEVERRGLVGPSRPDAAPSSTTVDISNPLTTVAGKFVTEAVPVRGAKVIPAAQRGPLPTEPRFRQILPDTEPPMPPARRVLTSDPRSLRPEEQLLGMQQASQTMVPGALGELRRLAILGRGGAPDPRMGAEAALDSGSFLDPIAPEMGDAARQQGQGSQFGLIDTLLQAAADPMNIMPLGVGAKAAAAEKLMSRGLMAGMGAYMGRGVAEGAGKVAAGQATDEDLGRTLGSLLLLGSMVAPLASGAGRKSGQKMLDTGMPDVAFPSMEMPARFAPEERAPQQTPLTQVMADAMMAQGERGTRPDLLPDEIFANAAILRDPRAMARLNIEPLGDPTAGPRPGFKAIVDAEKQAVAPRVAREARQQGAPVATEDPAPVGPLAPAKPAKPKPAAPVVGGSARYGNAKQRAEYAKAEAARKTEPAPTREELDVVLQDLRENPLPRDEANKRLARFGYELSDPKDPLTPKQRARQDASVQAVSDAFAKTKRREPLTPDEWGRLNDYATRGYVQQGDMFVWAENQTTPAAPAKAAPPVVEPEQAKGVQAEVAPARSAVEAGPAKAVTPTATAKPDTPNAMTAAEVMAKAKSDGRLDQHGLETRHSEVMGTSYKVAVPDHNPEFVAIEEAVRTGKITAAEGAKQFVDAFGSDRFMGGWDNSLKDVAKHFDWLENDKVPPAPAKPASPPAKGPAKVTPSETGPTRPAAQWRDDLNLGGKNVIETAYMEEAKRMARSLYGKPLDTEFVDTPDGPKAVHGLNPSDAADTVSRARASIERRLDDGSDPDLATRVAQANETYRQETEAVRREASGTDAGIGQRTTRRSVEEPAAAAPEPTVEPTVEPTTPQRTVQDTGAVVGSKAMDEYVAGLLPPSDKVSRTFVGGNVMEPGPLVSDTHYMFDTTKAVNVPDYVMKPDPVRQSNITQESGKRYLPTKYGDKVLVVGTEHKVPGERAAQTQESTGRVSLVGEKTDVHVQMHESYLALARRMYPDAEFYVQNGENPELRPIAVVHNGEVVGAIMPMNGQQGRYGSAATDARVKAASVERARKAQPSPAVKPKSASTEVPNLPQGLNKAQLTELKARVQEAKADLPAKAAVDHYEYTNGGNAFPRASKIRKDAPTYGTEGEVILRLSPEEFKARGLRDVLEKDGSGWRAFPVKDAAVSVKVPDDGTFTVADKAQADALLAALPKTAPLGEKRAASPPAKPVAVTEQPAGERQGAAPEARGPAEEGEGGAGRVLESPERDIDNIAVTGDERITENVRATSRPQVPAGFRAIPWKRGGVNADIGGGRYDIGSDYLRGAHGIENHVVDAYSRDEAHNRREAEYLADNPADTATVMNVLNVIRDDSARSDLIASVREYVKPGAEIYFQVYDALTRGATSSGTWQEGRPLRTYLPEVQAHYPDAVIRDGMIVAHATDAPVRGREFAAPERDIDTLDAPALGGVTRDTADPRIVPSPLPGGDGTKKVQDIFSEAAAALSRTIKQGSKGRGRRRAAGSYDPTNTLISIARHGNLGVLAHEIGHNTDDLLGLASEWAGQDTSPYDTELGHYAAYGSTGPDATYQRAEGVAEFLYAWMMNPEAVGRRSAQYGADSFLAFLNANADPKILASLRAMGDDMRRIAGLDPTSYVLSNVRDTPKRSRSLLDIAASGVEDFAYEWIDDIAAARGAARKVYERQGKDGARGDVFSRMADTWRGFNGTFEAILNHGMVDADLNVIDDRPLLKRLFEHFDRDPETFRRQRKATIAYLDSHKVVEKGEQWIQEARDKVAALDPKDPHLMAKSRKIMREAEQRAARQAGFGGNLQGSDLEAARRAMADIESSPDWAVVEKSVAEYRKLSDEFLDYWTDQGMISREEAAEMRANNEFYADMHRNMEDEAGWMQGANSADIHAYKGSGRELLDPYAALLSNMFKLMRRADRNAMYRTFVEPLRTERDIYEGPPAHLAEFGYEVGSPGANTITVRMVRPYKKADGTMGERAVDTHWEIPDKATHRALVAAGETVGTPDLQVFRALQRLAQAQRLGVTMGPAFRGRNAIRDWMQRLIISRTGSKAPPSRGTLAERRDLALAGGAFSGHYMGDWNQWAHMIEDAINHENGKPVNMARKAWRWWEAAGENMERMGRIPEYRSALERAKAQGLTGRAAKVYAAWEARNLQDFTRGGRSAKALSRYVPFTNAAIQGLVRAAQGAKENPAAFTSRWLAYAVLPTLAFRAARRMQGSEDEWREQPAYLRYGFYGVKLSKNFWLRIPKPFELGVLAGVAEVAADAVEGKSSQAGDWFAEAAKQMLPVDESAILGGPMRGAVEGVANYDFFKNRSIRPKWEEDLALNLRAGQSSASRLGMGASAAGDWASKIAPWMPYVGMDARTWDHILQAQFGEVGRLAGTVSNIGRKDTSGALAYDVNAITGMAVPSPGRNSESVKGLLDKAYSLGLGSSFPVRRIQQDLRQADRVSDAEADKIKVDVRKRAAAALPIISGMAPTQATKAAKKQEDFKSKRKRVE